MEDFMSTNREEVKNFQCHVKNKAYTVDEIKTMISGRKVYIWGAGPSGRTFLRAFEREGFKVEAFLDNDIKLIGKYLGGGGIPIITPGTILEALNLSGTSFIITASYNFRKREMFEACKQKQLRYKKDFIDIQAFSYFIPAVEISGMCNLKCIACPRGDTFHSFFEGGGYMRTGNYQKILQKLIKEIPFLSLVDLYTFGEPLLNPDLPEIIRINNKLGIGSGISTNLNYGKYLEEVVKANPIVLRVSVSGLGNENYGVTHKGASWEIFYANLCALEEYIKKFHAETTIMLIFHVNKNNMMEYADIYNLAKEHGFRLTAISSTLFPDYVMDYLDGKQICDGAKKAKDLMPISLEEMLEFANSEHEKSCILTRCLPVINWDMSVLTCCNYSYDKLADNYLDITLDEIIRRRNEAELCKKCIQYSLHRYRNLSYRGGDITLGQKLFETTKLPEII
jgi:wyosine [tRNA(Phe)-imidazoG37] synthetase (radical SAM superfamily)